jgi:hypothetical protein
MESFLIGRVACRFGGDEKAEVRTGLSALALDAEGTLWTASDEKNALERLSPTGNGMFENHDSIDLVDMLAIPQGQADDEIDIEGMDARDGALWLAGSHSTTRKKAKGKNDAKDLERLATVKRRQNRYILARLPMLEGLGVGKAARLPFAESGNLLTDALLDDPHFGPFLRLVTPAGSGLQLACKENGFDIEGLAVRGARVFLGLRGPVLRGWAALLEIEPTDAGDGTLTLAPIGDEGRPYRKHFIDIEGMGVRDLQWFGDALLILSGPTMDIDGRQTVWRLKKKAVDEDDSVTHIDGKHLKALFDLPDVRGADKAEGMAIYDQLGERGLMIVYDSPSAARQPDSRTVLADVFRLPKV